MGNAQVKYFLIGTLTAASVIFLALTLARSIGEKPNTDHLALERMTEQTKCPAPARWEYEVWGKSGMIAKCQIEHGPFFAAEGGAIALQGENNMGKPSGEWKWLDKSGGVEKTEKH